MSSIGRDLRHAVRALVRSPGLTVVVVLTLGLGIGANTTVFAWLDSIVRRPFPGIPDGGSLVALNVGDANGQVQGMPPISYPVLQDWIAGTTAFVHVAAHAQTRLYLRASAAERGDPIWSELAAAPFFAALGVVPHAGRFFDGTDEVDRAAVIVVSHGLWQRRFGGDSTLVGRTLLVNGVPLTVIGIAPPRFGGVVTGLAFDAWVPLWMQPTLIPGSDWMRDRDARRLQAVARLRPGVGLPRAREELNRVARDVSRAMGETPPTGAGARWISDTQLGSLMGPLGLAMMTVTVVVLMTACANVAGLLLARGVSRQRQTAIQVAVGASRRHLVQPALVHAALLALLGGAVGLWIAQLTKDALRYFVPRVSLPVRLEVDLNWRVSLFAFAIAIVSALAFALVPALRASAPDIVEVLKSPAGGGASRSRLRGALVVAQVAFSVLALATATLFLRSVAAAGRVPRGFDDPARVLLVSTDLSFTRLSGEALVAATDRALDGVRGLSGVAGAAVASFVPLSFGGPPGIRTRIEQYVPGPEEAPVVDRAVVSDGYFQTMGIPIVEGRDITTADRAGVARVVVVNQAFVRRYWPGQSGVGRRVDQGDGWATVVGVARNSMIDSLTEPARPIVYHPWAQQPVSTVTLHVRSAGADPLPLVEPVRQALAAAHADLAALDPGTLADHMQAAVFVQSVGASAFSVFGLLAALIATIGLYGVVAQYVAERRREIAITAALGASPRRIALAAALPALRLTAAGLTLGAALAAGAALLLRSLLIGQLGIDTTSIAVSVVALASAAAASCVWPAWRATRTDPVIAIRQ